MLGATDTDSTSFARVREASTRSPIRLQSPTRVREASAAELVDDGGKRDAATGRFLPGNHFWVARASSGPAPKCADAASLWKACVDYFEWVDENPLQEVQLVTYRGRATHVPVRKLRPMSKRHLCHFLGIAHTTWAAWKRNRPDLAPTIEHVESVLWDWNFGGAAAGLLDAGMIMRQLGLARKTEVADMREADQ
jgi:hypothetical protein